MWTAKKESAPGPDGWPHSVSRCVGESISNCFFTSNIQLLDGIFFFPPSSFVVSRQALLPKSIVDDDQDRLVRSLGALRTLTLCICESQILTTVLCFGLRQYFISCFLQCQDASQPIKWRIKFPRLRQRSLSNYVKGFQDPSHEFYVLLPER